MRYFLAEIPSTPQYGDPSTRFFVGAENDFHARHMLMEKALVHREVKAEDIVLRDVTESMSDGFIIADVTPSLIIYS